MVLEKTSERSLGLADPETRYEARSVLGQGGMGKVFLALDKRFGREVAMKVLRDELEDDHGIRARFVREACVQAQLEHPAILPAYDLGLDASGSLYFTMKRLRGLTLAEVLAKLQRGEPGTERRYGLHTLLSDFLDVCQAVHFAHSHGVIHRDLKPSNVMLGDYGEVYVVDWGIAKIVGGDEAGLDPRELPSRAIEDGGPPTVAGDVVGTPGYMAPSKVAAHNVARPPPAPA